MPEVMFPEILAATDALERRIAATEAEVVQMKESMTAKKQLLRRWRKAVAAIAPLQTSRTKRTPAAKFDGKPPT